MLHPLTLVSIHQLSYPSIDYVLCIYQTSSYFLFIHLYNYLKTLSVLNPLQQADANTLRNTDLAGPLIFCLLFGGILLLVSCN